MATEMTLEELRDRFGLSEDVVRFCEASGLTNLSRIQAHEAAHDTFLTLHGCEERYEAVLLNLLTIIRSHDEAELSKSAFGTPISSMISPNPGAGAGPVGEAQLTQPIGEDVNLTQLYAKGMITVRAYHVCRSASLDSLSVIREFALRHGGFGKLRNCGRKTELELEELLSQLGQIARPDQAKEKPKPAARRTAYVGEIFAPHYLRLSTRSRNLLTKHAGSAEPERIVQFLLDQGDEMPRLPGCGRLVMHELAVMRKQLFDDLAGDVVANLAHVEEATPQQLWMKRHQVAPGLYPVMFRPDGKLGLLRFMESYLGQGLSVRHKPVYDAFLLNASDFKTLTACAALTGLTRERVRQISVKLGKELSRDLRCISDLPGVQDQYAELITSEPWLVLEPAVMAEKNQQEGTDWSALFFGHLAKELNGAGYAIVKWSKVLPANRHAKRLDLSTPLLVEESLIPHLLNATNHLEQSLGRKREETEQLPLRSLPGVLESGQEAAIVSLLARIIFHGLPELRLEGYSVVLASNSKERQDDKLEHVLTKLDGPSHVSVILAHWNERYPDEPITEGGIRSIVVRNKERFFSIGRTSTYGLRCWESERHDLKGGTIRDIVHECLTHSKVPLHIEDLTETIRYFRPETNVASVRQNLKLDVSGRFVFLPGGMVGLAGVSYDAFLPSPVPVAGSLMRAAVLKKFIGRHRNDLIAYIKRKSQAPDYRISRVLATAERMGRLRIDEDGRIISVGK